MRYVVCSMYDWGWDAYKTYIKKFPGEWHFVYFEEDLEMDWLERYDPKYIFFIHWSSIVPKEITDRFECICFHPTALPNGRGGTPVQNMIDQGFEDTTLTAFRMTEELDAGPIYLQAPMSLLGGAEEIYIRMAFLASKMIRTLIDGIHVPVEQGPSILRYKRRKPEQSLIDKDSLFELFNHIRMLDAHSYPYAFLEFAGFRFEFTRPALRVEAIEADVRITKIDD